MTIVPRRGWPVVLCRYVKWSSFLYVWNAITPICTVIDGLPCFRRSIFRRPHETHRETDEIIYNDIYNVYRTCLVDAFSALNLRMRCTTKVCVQSFLLSVWHTKWHQSRDLTLTINRAWCFWFCILEKGKKKSKKIIHKVKRTEREHQLVSREASANEETRGASILQSTSFTICSVIL